MEEPIFYVPKKKYTEESVVVSIRMPRDMLRDIDEAVRLTGRNRNELLMASIEFSLKHLEILPAD